MIKQKKNSGILLLVYLLVVAVCCIGWIMNIINLFNTKNFELSGVIILQIVGIFLAPLGVVMGYLI